MTMIQFSVGVGVCDGGFNDKGYGLGVGAI